ncbi:hypothetical protein [Anaerosporobacter sp.]|uniref:hypothetical protein n=1 Tax=Anaerosporobacter sp. TaxID=1872529 RepID=UPI00286F4223|nr:hypothetical protein [Anaerosporobacter sp.]
MEDLKQLNACQIIERAKTYESRMKSLEKSISEFISGGSELADTEWIKQEYAELKKIIKKEHDYFSKQKNDISDISQVHSAYQNGILECSAWGFSSRIGSGINQDLFNSIEEAEYKLTKFLADLDEWNN